MHMYRYHYNAKWVKTDSSIEIELTHDSTDWVIYSKFYFDSTATCYAYSNERCDSFALPQLKAMLKNPEYHWTAIGNNKYLSSFFYSELLEVVSDGNCILNRRTKLHLTRRQYKALKSQHPVE